PHAACSAASTTSSVIPRENSSVSFPATFGTSPLISAANRPTLDAGPHSISRPAMKTAKSSSSGFPKALRMDSSSCPRPPKSSTRPLAATTLQVNALSSGTIPNSASLGLLTNSPAPRSPSLPRTQRVRFCATQNYPDARYANSQARVTGKLRKRHNSAINQGITLIASGLSTTPPRPASRSLCTHRGTEPFQSPAAETPGAVPRHLRPPHPSIGRPPSQTAPGPTHVPEPRAAACLALACGPGARAGSRPHRAPGDMGRSTRHLPLPAPAPTLRASIPSAHESPPRYTSLARSRIGSSR